MKRGIVLLILIALSALSLTVAAVQQTPAPAASGIAVDKLKDNLYVRKAWAPPAKYKGYKQCRSRFACARTPNSSSRK